MMIINQCPDTIWPGLVTQGGGGPSTAGFELSSGSNKTINVGSDWQGRVWGRTNCTFNDPNHPGGCLTGECGSLSCIQAGNPPATLAEFTMDGGQDQTFYDISLVDGYNLPLAIVLQSNGVSELDSIKSSSTNPSCVGSVNDFAGQNFQPYSNNQQFLGTNSSDPLDFDSKVTTSQIAQWCPWDLQVNPPQAPGDGVYPYPDDNVQRPSYNPCYSACAKYTTAQYCCTGSYSGQGNCGPNYYSKVAKQICPDAYSYANDDQDSSFIVPKGGEFNVIFCPGGRSTNIIANNQKAGSSGSSSAPAGSRPASALFAAKSLTDGILWKGVYVGFWLFLVGGCMHV